MNKDEFDYSGSIEAGNSIYRVIVQDNKNSSGLGTYTIKTGPAHPAGPNLSVLFGGSSDNPWTSFNTIRSATTSTDYVQSTNNPASNFNVITLDKYGTIERIGTTGVRTTYILPGPPETPDSLKIISEINVLGTTAQESLIEVRTKITNLSAISLLFGVRYLWDHQISLDDGPTFKALDPDGPELTTEIEYNRPNFSLYRMEDNDVNPNPPTFFVYGIIKSPLYPTPIIGVEYVSWPNAFHYSAFDYTVNQNLDIATTQGAINDSAVLIYFGHSYIELAPNETVETVANIGLAPPIVSDLQITATPLPNLIGVGQLLKFNLTIANNGPDEAANVVVTDTLPNDVDFISATSTQGTCIRSGGIVTCNLGNLSNGANANVIITVIPTKKGTITNTATVASDDLDPDSSNNTVTQSIIVTNTNNPTRGFNFFSMT